MKSYAEGLRHNLGDGFGKGLSGKETDRSCKHKELAIERMLNKYHELRKLPL